ncbi:hypothetical protein PG985_007429 [Apiospora marii]|uniref:uncharacterized protein n=1 Tax=Apiospora marii TaxID=335849 RepID=UPI003131659F
MTMPSPYGDDKVEVYTQKPPEALLQLLSAHLPRSLSLLRRLQFTKFPGGVTEHARILYASDTALPSAPLNVSGVTTSAMEHHHPFTAAYLDISRGPETQLWMYSTLERCSNNKDSEDGGDEKEEENHRQKALRHTVSILRTVRRLRDEYAAVPSQSSPLGPFVLAGTLSEALRIALRDEVGVASSNVSPYDKWLLDARALPSPVGHEKTSLLDPGMRWGTVGREDIALVLSRSDVPRKDNCVQAGEEKEKQERGGVQYMDMETWADILAPESYRKTVKLLPSTAITLEDGTPIAWCFLGPDGSLSSLHCEEPYRGRGFAKAVAIKLLKDRLRDYGGDDSTLFCAEVAQDNASSQGVCKSLGGKIGWAVSW